jgi:predicted RNA binding protein YcfA (HicA-like mRNA interferase family)
MKSSGSLDLSALPRILGRDAVRALRKIGYEFDRQNGSHLILRQMISPYRRLVVPDHKEIAKGTLRAIIRQPGITVDQFC